MVTENACREMALSFAAVTEQPHFDKASFRVNKKIFATLDVARQRMSIKLSAMDQSVFAAFDATIIYPVPNKWGQQGWTIIELAKIKKAMLKDALAQAYKEVVKKKPAAKKVSN